MVFDSGSFVDAAKRDLCLENPKWEQKKLSETEVMEGEGQEMEISTFMIIFSNYEEFQDVLMSNCLNF